MDKEADGQREGESTRVWYFAYGSNMSPITLGRRRLRPSESVAGVLVGYRLLFDHVGVPFFEPSFANIVPEKGCCVHGVLHSLTARHVQKHSHHLLLVVVVVVEGAPSITCHHSSLPAHQ